MDELLTSVRTWLDGQDGPLVAAAVIAAFVLLVVLCSLYNALAKVDRPARPRRESLSERHERLDAEARTAASVDIEANLQARWSG